MAKPKSQKGLDLVYNNEFAQPVEINKKNFSVHDLVNIKAKTEPQQEFFHAYFKKQIPIITQLGSAGTGKTAIALYSALYDVLDNTSVYDKIIIIRSAVQSRDIGFLKGSEEEKNEAYEKPYMALCDELLKYKSNNYANLKSRDLIEFENTSFLRGQTWNNCVVIVDECQSMTYHELSTCLTRVGNDSRIIFCGDLKQNDLHKKGDVSGLLDFKRVLDAMSEESVEHVAYRPEHIIRSGLVREFLMAEEKVL